MLLKNKTFKLVVFLLCLGFITFITSVTVNAAKVNIVKDPNIEGVQILSFDEENYYIEIDDSTGYGYVICYDGYSMEVLGTCSVKIINLYDELMLCSEDTNMNSYGLLTILVTNENANEGYVYSIEGQLSNFFELNSRVIIEE